MSHDQPSQRPADPRRKLWIAVLLGVAAVGVLLLVAKREHEPSHAGKTLSQWLAVLDTGRFGAVDQRPVLNPDAVQAIQAMGEAAVPFLIGNIDAGCAAQLRDDTMGALHPGISSRLFGEKLKRRVALGWQSVMALSVLGERATNALPQLLELSVRYPALPRPLLIATAATGPNAVGAISNALNSPEFVTRRAAIEASAYLGAPGTELVPALIAIHTNTQADRTDRSMAAWALGRIKGPSNEVAAALRQSLASTNAAVAGQAAFGLMLAGVRETVVAEELAAQVRGADDRLNLYVLLSLTVLETNNTRLVSLLKQHVSLNPNPKQRAETVFNDVRQTWTNCDEAGRTEMYAMLQDLIAMRGPN